MNITPEQEKAINKLTDYSNMETDLIYIIKESDAEDMDTLTEDIEEQTNGFQVEMIYYHKAMEYLLENDPSLQYSLELAADMGFEIKNLNSELLASLLASQNEREEYEKIKEELKDILYPEVAKRDTL